MKNKLLEIRKEILVFLTHRIALPVLKKLRKPHVFIHTMADLEKLPAGSLGHDLFLFLQKRNLELMPHYARHDLKHVLLGYDTSEEGEVCLQSFMFGNGRVSIPVVSTLVYGLVTMPEYWGKMRKAFQKGRKSAPVHDLYWNEIVFKKTGDLRKEVFNY